jgi:hypothetical protein
VSARPSSTRRPGSGRSDRRIEMQVAKAVLTTAVDARVNAGRPDARASFGLFRGSTMDSPGRAKPPEKRKVGGSTPPLTTSSEA